MNFPWDLDRALTWYNKLPWLCGCNYIPSYAINQLEMFQPDTFNLDRIDEELTWAKIWVLIVCGSFCITYFGKPMRLAF